MIDIPLLIAIAEIKKKSSRHGSMSQRWWQNRIYGLQFGTLGDSYKQTSMFIMEAIYSTKMALGDHRLSRSSKNNLRAYLTGLEDANQAIEQRQKEGEICSR